jgi:hypothetical protein
MSAILKHTLRNTFRNVGLVVCLAALLAACASARSEKPKSVGVGVRSINYSGKEVELTVVDPLDKSNRSGGDALNPYSMGGTICCFSVPAEWHAGYQVIVKYSFYPDQTWHEQLVDVPPYPQGIAGEIWLAMHEDGRAEAVVSNFDPTRPEWPGRVRGRPVQSPEYAKKVRNEALVREKKILGRMEKAYAGDTSNLTPDQVRRLRDGIETSKRIIKGLEESQ